MGPLKATGIRFLLCPFQVANSGALPTVWPQVANSGVLPTVRLPPPAVTFHFVLSRLYTQLFSQELNLLPEQIRPGPILFSRPIWQRRVL